LSAVRRELAGIIPSGYKGNMIRGYEVEVDLINKGDLVGHFSIRPLDGCRSIGQEFPGHRAGCGNTKDTRHVGNGGFDRLDVLLDLVVTFEIEDQQLIFPETQIMIVHKGQLTEHDDRSGDQDNGDGKLEND